MSAPPPVRIRKRRTCRAVERRPWVWLLLLALIGLLAPFAYQEIRTRWMPADLEGYVHPLAALQQEYEQFEGSPLSNAGAIQEFAQASREVRERDYRGAAALLEDVSTSAPLPAVFNNLGVLYDRLGDHGRAAVAFREALARDAGYRQVRLNLQRLKGYAGEAVEPAAIESEPNRSAALANLLGRDRPVRATIGAANDEDYFRFASPPAPRDRLEITVETRSPGLRPAIQVQYTDRRPLQAEQAAGQPGANLVTYAAPAPNSTVYVRVRGLQNTQGNYVLTVHPMHAYDEHEPNDDIAAATPLRMGTAMEANIMDERDTDYYVFVNDRAGQVSIELQNLSSTLIPTVGVSGGDRRFSTFGPDGQAPGAGVRRTAELEAGKTYHIQVSPQAGSSGAYRLRLTAQ